MSLLIYIHADFSHFEKVIQQLKAQAEEESRPYDANDAVDVNEVTLPILT